MPTINLDRKVLDKLVGKKLSDSVLMEKIPMLGTSLESIDDNEIVIEVFPNRPDMLSEQGFARALSSFLGIKTGLKTYGINKSGIKVIIERSVKKVRPYTACAIVKNLKLNDEKIKEIIDIQEKLHITYGRHRKKVAIGIYPFEKIKPPIRFTAQDPKEIKFRPLDFPREIPAIKILSQHPTGRDYAHLLEGYDKFPFFIDSNDEVMSMPPIINSETTGRITKDTTDVFVECSGFDFNTLSKCLNIIVYALADMGGKIYSVKLDYQGKKIETPILKPEEMKLDINYVNKRLGLELKEKDIKKLLGKMGYGYKNKKVLVPPYRADVMHMIDLVEDIAIAYGYDNIKENLPNISTSGQESKLEIFKRKTREILAGLKFIEVNTYHITNKDLQTTKMDFKARPIELANALNTDFNVLRAWLIPNLMEVLKNNKHNEYPQNIFTLGKTFKENEEEETGIKEEEKLAVMKCSNKTDFTDIKQTLDYLMRSLSLNYEIKEYEHTSFIEGRIGEIIVNNSSIGIIGEIKPQVLELWDIEIPVTCFEIDMEKLFNLIK